MKWIWIVGQLIFMIYSPDLIEMGSSHIPNENLMEIIEV